MQVVQTLLMRKETNKKNAQKFDCNKTHILHFIMHDTLNYIKPQLLLS